MTAPIFVPPKTRTVAHKDQNEYVKWNPSTRWKRTRMFSWNTGICVKKFFCIFEKLLVVCFLIVGEFCVLSVNSMSIYLSSWPTLYKHMLYWLSFHTHKNLWSSKRSFAKIFSKVILPFHFTTIFLSLKELVSSSKKYL